MKTDDFEFISHLVKSRSGLVLGKDQTYLLESRLMPVARKKGLRGFTDLVDLLRTKRDENLLRDVTEAMTTNESYFFRDIKPFEHFENVTLPHLLATRAARKSLRIWCAAASSGQEPYSLAMILNQHAAQLAGWQIEIIGSDIAAGMLEKARTGLYSQFEVQRGLPIRSLLTYFQRRDDLWEIDAALRGMVKFREFNLLDDPSTLGIFDVVFCRNVLIYFDQQAKSAVLDRAARLLPDDGVLYLGGAETVLGLSNRFKPVAGYRGVYGLAPAKPAAKPSRPTVLRPVASSDPV